MDAGFVTGSPADRSLQAQQRTDEAVEERPAPDANREQAGEYEHDVDAHAALALPVDVLQVQPERKLVERERGADAEEDRGEAGDPARPDAHLEQPDGADDDQYRDAPDQVMDVGSARAHVVEWADAGADRDRDRPNDPEGQEKRQRSEEQPLPPLVVEVESIELREDLHGAEPLPREVPLAPGDGRDRVFDHGKVVAVEHVDVTLERERPVLGWPLAHVVEAIRDLLGRYPVGLVEQYIRSYVHAPRVVLVPPRRLPDGRVVLVHRGGDGDGCGEAHSTGHVVQEPVADPH